MKKTSLSKFGVMIAVLSVAVPVVINSSFAQELLPSQFDKSNSVIACVADADLKYKDFISSTIAYDGFVDYWGDIFNKNYCEQRDIQHVLDSIEQVRTNIRSAFYACDDDRARNLGVIYDKLLVELYYVRHVTFTDQKNPKSPLSVVNPAIYENMRSRFVDTKSYFSKAVFDEYYAQLNQKYQKSLAASGDNSYLSCSDPVFDDLTDKWQEFLETAGGLGSGTKAANKKIGTQAKRLESSPVQSYGSSYERYLNLNVNSLDPLDSFDQIYNATKEVLPFTDVGLTHEQLFNGVSQAQEVYDASKSKAQKMATYEFLYLNTTDSLRDSLEKKLKESNAIIKNTFQPLTSLGDCVGTVYSRQCKSSE